MDEYSVQPGSAGSREECFAGYGHTATAADIHAFFFSAGLSSVRSTLSPVANMLRQERVWPLARSPN